MVIILFFFIQNKNKCPTVKPEAVYASLWTSFNFGSAARKYIFIVHIVGIYVAVLPRNASQGQGPLHKLQTQNTMCLFQRFGEISVLANPGYIINPYRTDCIGCCRQMGAFPAHANPGVGCVGSTVLRDSLEAGQEPGRVQM